MGGDREAKFGIGIDTYCKRYYEMKLLHSLEATKPIQQEDAMGWANDY